MPIRLLTATAALSLILFVALLLTPRQAPARIPASSCSTSASHSQRSVRACAHAMRKGSNNHRRRAGKPRHAKHAVHRTAAKMTRPSSPKTARPAATVESPASCEDGSAPVAGPGGSLACNDGSEPACADGSSPTMATGGSSLACAAEAGSGAGEPGCEAQVSGPCTFDSEAPTSPQEAVCEICEGPAEGEER